MLLPNLSLEELHMSVKQSVRRCQYTNRLHACTTLQATFNRHVLKTRQTKHVLLSEVSVDHRRAQ